MRSSKPPALATWLVEHLIPGDSNEALAGDLLEQFSQGRSSAWYWRQALAAIFVGFSKELRILWMAMAFTLVWISALSLFYGRIWSTALGEFLSLPWAVSLLNTVGFLTVVNALPIPAALAMYLGATRSFSLRRFSRGLFAGLFALALGTFPGSALLSTWHHSGVMTELLSMRFGLRPESVAIERAYGTGEFLVWLIYTMMTLPVFFALLASMWAARPTNPRPEPARVPV